MDIRDYDYIVSIAEHQSISKAAAALFVTQSALTKYLQRVERQIGLTLFIRHGHQFQLTDAGRRYVETARQIRNLDRELMQELEQLSLHQKNHLRIGFGIGRSTAIFDLVLHRFYRKYPDINVLTKLATSRESLQMIEQGDLDLALVVSAERLADITYQPVTPSHLAVVVREESPLLAKGIVTARSPYPVLSIHELSEHSLILTVPSTRSGALARRIFAQYSVPYRLKLEVGDTRVLLDAVEGGLGAGVLLSVPLGKRRLRYLLIAETMDIQETVSVVWRSDREISGAMRDMIQWLCEIE